MAELGPRARQILYAAVTEFVGTGQPVGSRTLSKKCGIDLSPATIRNVLADLEELGYLHQPHASAGRIPTPRAFRLFIDALMEVKEIAPQDHASIRARFEQLEPGQNVMRETGKLLSELTGTAAVVVAPRAETLTLKHLRFVRTRPDQVLAVLVFSNGTVQNRFLSGTASDNELARVHAMLDDVVEGRSLGDLHSLFSRRLADERVRHDEARRLAFELGERALAHVAGAGVVGADVVIEGRAKLLEKPEFADPAGMKQVVSALDEREQIVHLLEATLEAKGATVVVGNETGELAGGQLAIVGAPYMDHGRTAGTIGVIGPTRMDYPKVVPLVAATAHAMSVFMERAAEREGRDADDGDRDDKD
jgi:heat-inducible transcriptional repressor